MPPIRHRSHYPIFPPGFGLRSLTRRRDHRREICSPTSKRQCSDGETGAASSTHDQAAMGMGHSHGLQRRGESRTPDQPPWSVTYPCWPCLDPAGFQRLWELGLHKRIPADLPSGAVIGMVRLVNCTYGYPSPWAARGFWHWVLDRPREFNTPISCRGSQTLFIPDVSQQKLGQARRHAIRHRSRPKK